MDLQEFINIPFEEGDNFTPLSYVLKKAFSAVKDLQFKTLPAVHNGILSLYGNRIDIEKKHLNGFMELDKDKSIFTVGFNVCFYIEYFTTMQDINREDIKADANTLLHYIEKGKPDFVDITKCSINLTQGLITVEAKVNITFEDI